MNKLLAEQYITLLEDKINDWQQYIDKIPMLKVGVDLLKDIERIGGANSQAYIVGGAIRDIITGEKEPDDIDIATNVSINELEKHFKTFNIGANKNFGIIVINKGGFSFEVATFRSDGTYTDGRRPDTIEIVSDFSKDAERRDFTINAMGVDKDGNIIDYFDGYGDIKNKVIRTVGDPNKRFGEDYLRMLRAVRFSSRMGFKIDPETMKAIKSNSANIKGQAVERIVNELMKMASQNGSKFADAIITLKETDLLQYILPEVDEMENLEHHPDHHPEGNVMLHSLSALRVADSNDPLVNLSILLHDVGKLTSKQEGDDGYPKYHGHAGEGVQHIENIAKRLKLDNYTKNCLIFCTENHMKMHDLDEIKPSKIMNLMENPYWDILLQVAEADTKSRMHKHDPAHWKKMLDIIDNIKQRFKNKKATDVIKTVVNGKHIMDILNIPPSKKLGIIIKDVTDWVLDNNININNIEMIDDKIREVGASLKENNTLTLKEQYDKLN